MTFDDNVNIITVDIMAHAMDNPVPGTIVLITGDRDFAYVVSVLRMRRYRIVVIVPPNHHCTIRHHASAVLDWDSDILLKGGVGLNGPVDKSPGSISHPTPTSIENSSPVSSGAISHFQKRFQQSFYHLLAAPHVVQSVEKHSTPIANISLPPSSPTFSSRAPNSSLVVMKQSSLATGVTEVSPDLAGTFGSLPKSSLQTTLQPLIIDQAPSLLTNTLNESDLTVTPMYVVSQALSAQNVS